MIQVWFKMLQKMIFILGICFITKGVFAADRVEGHEVFLKWCSACHMDSPFAPATIRLRYSKGEEFALLEKRNDLPAYYIRALVRKGLNGMPLFRKTEINDKELEALVDYLAPVSKEVSK